MTPLEGMLGNGLVKGEPCQSNLNFVVLSYLLT